MASCYYLPLILDLILLAKEQSSGQYRYVIVKSRTAKPIGIGRKKGDILCGFV